MTHEEKQLLLQDLSARLPYGCKVSVQGGEFDKFQHPMLITAISKFENDSLCKVYNSVYTPFGSPKIEDVKPYLRPMSSMTEDERKEFRATQYEEVIEQYPCSADPNEIKILSYTTKTFDWLNKHYFDFRGLIKKGLAIEAPKEMY